MSSPPCLDQENKLITRQCINGSWIPSSPPLCHVLINDNKECPNFFIETEVCAVVTAPVHWNERCTALMDKISTSFQPKSTNYKSNLIWIPAKRRVKYGPYEYMTMDSNHGRTINPKFNISIKDDIFNRDCLLYHPRLNNLIPEYCDKLYPHVCIFQKDSGTNKCSKGCIPAGLGSKKCYCKIYDNVCENLAKIETPFEKNLLSKYAGNELCNIDNNQVITKDLWKTSNVSVSCSICIFDRPPGLRALNATSTPVLQMSFNKSKKKLYLIIYSPEGVFRMKDTEAVYCFTNASDDLKKLVKINKIVQSDDRKTFGLKERSVSVYEVKLEDYMGAYWCEAHKSNNFSDIVYSESIIAFKKVKINEYALRFQMYNACMAFDCGNLLNISFPKFIHSEIKTAFKGSDATFRVMDVINFDINANFLDLLIHVSTTKGRNRIGEFYRMKNLLDTIDSSIKVIYFRNAEYCIPFNEEVGGRKTSWPLTERGKSTLPKEICVSSNMPARRVCEGTFLTGAYWSDVTGECNFDEKASPLTEYLFNVYNTNITFEKINNISDMISKNDVTTIDVYYISKVLKTIYNSLNVSMEILNKTLEIVDNVSSLNLEKLRYAQEWFNVTDDIVDILEDAVATTDFNKSEVHTINSKNLFMYFTNPFLSNNSGIVVYSNSTVNSVNRAYEFESDIDKLDLKLLVYVPENVLNTIYNRTKGKVSDVNLIIIAYNHDTFFLSESKHSVGPVVSVNIPGHGHFLSNSIPILFKSSENRNIECGFWDYGKHTKRHRGMWSTVGGNYLGRFKNNTDLHICSFSHLTHFALLILQDHSVIIELTSSNYFILHVITMCGFMLSIIGLIGIVLTAVLFESWREKPGTKILLHLSVSIILQCLSVQLMDTDDIHSYTGCLITGMMLHYMVISKFCWMLVYAFLQYLRFVRVLGPLPNNLVLKSVFFGWGVGLVPVLITGLIDPHSYNQEDNYICYPKGLTLYLGVLLPICVVITINSIIFGIVMYEVRNKKVESNGNVGSNKLQIKLGVLLFFIFGLPWIFGILAEIIRNSWIRIFFIYIFSISVTLEQFVLFLFYIVFNKETRNKWITLLKLNK